MTNEVSKPFLGRVIGKTIGLFPSSLPLSVYRFLAKTPLKYFIDVCIRLTIPPLLSIEGGEVILDSSDAAVSGQLALGVYEKTEVDLFRKTVPSGATVVDIGAHIGYYTVIGAHRVGSTGRVFSFEPEPHNFSFLEKNIAHNTLAHVVAIPIGLADVSGERTLYVNATNKGHHSFGDDTHAGEKTLIPLDTLDHALAAYGSPVVDIIKMDIEGAEPLALKGMHETIARSPHLILFTEFYPEAIRRVGGNPLQFLHDLKNLGFSLSIIDEDKEVLIPLISFKEFLDEFPRGEVAKNLYAKKKSA